MLCFSKQLKDLHQGITWILKGYIKMLKDIFFYTTLYLLFWQGETIQATFLDNFFIKRMFISEIPKPVSLISVNHSQSFKMYCSFPLQDRKFITENMKPFIVLSEEVLVINWRLTKTISQKKIELVLQSVKCISGASLKYVLTDGQFAPKLYHL